jgi:hypothetical protein
VLSCTSSKERPDPVENLRAGIREVVMDPARASKMLTAVDQMEAAIAENRRLIDDERAALLSLLRDYRSSREEIERSLAEFNTRHEASAQSFLATHAALKAEATEPEWKKLRKLEMELLMFAAAQALGEKAAFEKES